MGIRFIFFIALFFSFISTSEVKLYAACDNDSEEGATEKEDALRSGNFSSCGQAGGASAFAAEFGNPREREDEEDENSELKPIDPTLWDNPENITFSAGSNAKFHFYTLKNNAVINVFDAAIADFQLHENTSDLVFNVINGEVTYRGGSKGKIDVFLPNSGSETSKFNSYGDINYLNFQGIIEKEGEDTEVVLKGGALNVGSLDEPVNIVINHLKGNGDILVNSKSKVVVKKYDLVSDLGDKNSLYYIQKVDGGGEIVFETDVGIKSLNISNATFNGKSTLLDVRTELNGKYIFNADSDVEIMARMSNMHLKNNSTMVINTLGEIFETNIDKGSKLELLGEGSPTGATHKLNKVQGEGTLHINANYADLTQHNAFKIIDVNLNTLILDGASLFIENDTADYTNVEKDPNDEENDKSTKVIRRIKNITQTNPTGTDLTGEITVDGTVIFDNIEALRKLTVSATVCAPEDTACAKKVNLTLKNVERLDELEVQGGNLYVEIDHTNYTNPALNLKEFNLTGGKFYSVIQDTNRIKHTNIYTILSAEDSSGVDPELKDFDTLLPEWYSFNYELSDDGKLTLEVTRDADYKGVIKNLPFTSDSNALAMASYFDEIISSDTPLGISAKTFTYIDLLSDSDTLANNLNSLVPISKDKYIKMSHTNLKEALDVSKRKGIENKKPYGIWDRRSEAKNPDNAFWFVSLASNAKYDAELNRDELSSTSYQFGYNLYNWVSNNNREGYSYSIVGGFTKGDLDHSKYNSNMTAFNIGNTLDYRDENDIIKLSLIYGLSSFDTQRDYFISDYDGEDFPDLDKSRLSSSLKTHEILLDMQYSHEIFIEYLRSFSTWSEVILVPRVYFTPSIFIGEGYKEKGEYSSLELDHYVSTIFESGFGFDLSKGVNFSSKSSMKVFVGVDSFYRYYKFPSNTLSFEEVASGIRVDNRTNWSGVVISTQAGIGFGYKKAHFSAFYKREIAHDYYQNVLGVSYKYSF